MKKGSKAKKTILANGQLPDGYVGVAQLLQQLDGNPYGTRDLNAFTAKLSNVDIIELQRIAINAGVSITGSISEVKDSLLRSFKQYCRISDDTPASASSKYQELQQKLNEIVSR